MEQKKNNQMIIIMILSIAILTMSVGFAAYSANLSIQGNVSIAGKSWDVHIDEDSYEETNSSNVSVSTDNRSINGTTLIYNVHLSKPGDKYEFTVDVVNVGSFDAKLDGIVLTNISEDVKKYLKYTVKYNDVDSSLVGNTVLEKVNGVDTVTVTVEYVMPEDIDDLPDDDMNISLLCVLNYIQV